MGGPKALYSHCFLSMGFSDFRRLIICLSQKALKFLLQKKEGKNNKKNEITLAAIARYGMIEREAVHN